MTKAEIKKKSSSLADRAEPTQKVKSSGFCAIPPIPRRELDPNLNVIRASLILNLGQKWVNGTVLHYYFLQEYPSWRSVRAEEDIVRQAFDIWKETGIGIDFKEVYSQHEAEIRIGFLRGDGAWSYIGRDALQIPSDQRTMNFGWDLTQDEDGLDTAIHEIGHALGFPHEHQNPNSNIVWNEEAVYAWAAQHPMSWDRKKTYHNIIRTLAPNSVRASEWDPNSIMHYPFAPGLILKPEEFMVNGLYPEPGLSKKDRSWAQLLYPESFTEKQEKLEPLRSQLLDATPGSQKDFIFKPEETRYYTFQSLGEFDGVIVLFEDGRTEDRYLTADDNSGVDKEAQIRIKLLKGRRYLLRIRTYYAPGTFAVVVW